MGFPQRCWRVLGGCCPPAPGSPGEVRPRLLAQGKAGSRRSSSDQNQTSGAAAGAGGMRLNQTSPDSPSYTDRGFVCLESESNERGSVQVEIELCRAAEANPQQDPAQSPRLPERTPTPGPPLISSLAPHRWEQDAVGCGDGGQQQWCWGDARDEAPPAAPSAQGRWGPRLGQRSLPMPFSSTMPAASLPQNSLPTHTSQTPPRIRESRGRKGSREQPGEWGWVLPAARGGGQAGAQGAAEAVLGSTPHPDQPCPGLGTAAKTPSPSLALGEPETLGCSREG